jgi:outer membrane protein assembly factor BamB
MSPRLTLIAAGLLVVAGFGLAAPARKSSAGDWPQWRGPKPDDICTETGLMKSFPGGGPPLAWKFEEAGIGYSGFAVVGGTLYGFGAVDKKGEEFVYALDTATGKEKWRTPIKNAKPLNILDTWGVGPRGTPTVDGDRVYVLGGQADLACLRTDTGSILWQVSLTKDLKGKLMSGWGYSESPLVDGDQVVCTPGGDGGTLAALDKMTGKVKWRSTGLSAQATYSSIIIAQVGDVRHYVQLTKDGPAGFNPKNGDVLWKEKVIEGDWKTAVIPTPVFHDNCVFVTAGYGAGCGLVKLTPDGKGGIKSKTEYANKVMENHHGGVVLVGEHIYGSAPKGLVCQNFKTGKESWAEKKVGKGSVIAADGCLYCYGEKDGTLICVEANPTKFVEKGRFKIPQTSKMRAPSGLVWTHPVIADGKMYLRDQELLFCFDLKNGKASGE